MDAIEQEIGAAGMAITHYEALSVDQDATRAEITSAFRAQMRALHADAGGDDELAKQVSAAYNVLSNATKRAAYDRTLAQTQPPRQDPTGSSPRQPDGATRRRDRVFTPQQAEPAFSMMDVDPSGWEWHVAAEDQGGAAAAGGAGSRSVLRTVLTVLPFLAWTAAGAAAASTLGLPLARIDALSTPMALLAGPGAHLSWSVLMITRMVLRRWGLILALAIAAGAAGVIYLDAGTLLPTLGAGLCLVASMATTYLSFGLVLARGGAREGGGIIDSSFITQVGATNIGDRHPDIDCLLRALQAAFGHRKGVRVILLPDRVTPRAHASPARAQVAAVIGLAVHLIAIPPIGDDGLEISGADLIGGGQVHRNVVRDEVQALAARLGRASRVRGYVIPTRLAAEPPGGTEAHGVTFGSLDQVVDAIGQDAGADLDMDNALFRRRALESMSLLL